MGELSPDLAGEIVEVCKAAAAEAAEALKRGIDADVKLSPGDPHTVSLSALPESFSGGGMMVVLSVGDRGAVVVLPESTGLLPDWCAQPDATGESKLTTLAQELGMILLPEAYLPDDFKAGCVKSLTEALARGELADAAAMIPLELLSADGRAATAGLIWPVGKPSALLGGADATPQPNPLPKPQPKSEAKPKTASEPEKEAAIQPKSPPVAKSRPAVRRKTAAGPTVPTPRRRPATLEELPSYTRSLLRIKLPVVVTLAQKQQTLGRIMELGPGSIIQFDKSCEEMLDLDVSGRSVATGEAVKVGDKFGLRINAVVLPEERFAALCLVKAGQESQQSPAPAGQTIGGRR